MLIGTSTLVSVNKPLVEVRLDAASRVQPIPGTRAWAASQLTTVRVPAPDDGGGITQPVPLWIPTATATAACGSMAVTAAADRGCDERTSLRTETWR